jgi:hypothetical protein
MPQIRNLIAAFALLVSLGSARATTFYVSGTSTTGTFYGTLNIRVDWGWVTGVNIIFPGVANFAELASSRFSYVGGWTIDAKNARRTATLSLVFTTSPNPGTLVGFRGGTILPSGVEMCSVTGTCQLVARVRSGIIGPPGITRFGPGTPTHPFPPPRFPTEAFGPCYSQNIIPACGPLRRPYCSRPIPCRYYGQIGSICAEWRCIVPPEIQRRRGARRGQ